MTTNQDVLNSWKEVASYMGRGVRTVQRWERELGLPVRRPRGKSRSAVIAFRGELDQWLHRAPSDLLQQSSVEESMPARPSSPLIKSDRHAELHDRTETLMGTTRILLSRSTVLCAQLKSLREKIDRTVKLTSVHVNRNAKSVGLEVITKPDGGGKMAAHAELPQPLFHKHPAIAS